MSIGKIIEKLRTSGANSPMSQKELAKKAGVNPTTIHRIEKGEIKYPRAKLLQRLAQALGVSVESLLTETGLIENREALKDERLNVLFRDFEKLSDEAKKQVEDYLHYIMEQDKKGGSN